MATVPGIAWSQPPATQIRSVADARERLVDEHDRPYFRETQSHRGWEIRTPQFTVFADTSAADARWAAGHVEQAWTAASTLARRWTDTPEQPDFALNALQVVITREPLRETDAPATTLNVVGIQTQVEISVSPGQPKLAQHVVRLREGAAFGMLHAAGLDSVSPPWVVAGVAAVAGQTGLGKDELCNSATGNVLPALGGQQWRYSRSAPDKLAYPASNHDEATSRVAFLLTGNDGQHAPAFFERIKRSQSAAVTRAAQSDAFSDDRTEAEGAFDRFLEERGQAFADWKTNPDSGQPIFEPAKNSSAEVTQAQREMVVLLKLHERFAAGMPVEPARKAKISELDEEGRLITRESGVGSGGVSFGRFAAHIVDPARGAWITLGPGGELLFSTDRERVNALLSPPGATYALQVGEGTTALVRKTENGLTIRGWLEPNPENKSRPIAKFEVLTAKRNVRVNEFKANGQMGRSRAAKDFNIR